ncbi:2-hydroxychromene-2-carboxylate isomerase [Chachezhania sediminis]|uniref:2-hydroxychromene-2-carboxylate isomerase n=1 Tax=Chachezhania sediminis TaxID=2599291 RepID=UPI00131CCA27|nr:2-hydroxychromene-2-carboxylate isomerase [Chachezhania sediminis]
MPNLDFWYSIGSPYSYLSVMRLADVADASGVSFTWRPFNVRHVVLAAGVAQRSPEKTSYMWRDIERRSQRYGLTPVLPAPYPLGGLVLANQVAMVGVEEGWVEEYTRVTFRRWFDEGQAAGEEPNLSDSLEEIGKDPEAVLQKAQSARFEKALRDQTEEAMALGVFGAPTFAFGEELFWGDDRLDDAVLWAKGEWG